MIFVDTNVFILYVGREHPRRSQARAFLEGAAERGQRLVTSSEVLQEILHYYHRHRRALAMDDAFELARPRSKVTRSRGSRRMQQARCTRSRASSPG